MSKIKKPVDLEKRFVEADSGMKKQSKRPTRIIASAQVKNVEKYEKRKLFTI